VTDNLVTKKPTFVVIALEKSAGEKMSFVDSAEAKFLGPQNPLTDLTR
jgi:hypothetical protein